MNTIDFDNDFGINEVQKSKIHIRYQKIGPRSITIVEGLDDDLDLKRISKAMKKAFSCAATVLMDDEQNELIQLQGDKRTEVKSWLVDQEILTVQEAKERIVIHGF